MRTGYKMKLQQCCCRLLAFGAFMWTALVSEQCPAAETIRINGSGAVLDMLKPFIAAYRVVNRDIRIEIEKPLGSSGAIKALLAGVLDLAAVSRRLTPEQIALGLSQYEYGRTPLAIVTEKSVRKQNVTTAELEQIYSGRVTGWQNGEKIRLVLRPRDDTNTLVLQGLSPGLQSAVNTAQKQHGMIVAVTDPEAYTTIAKTPGALGTTALTSIIVEKLPLNILSLNGVKPTTETLLTGAYPLFREIHFVTAGSTKPAVAKFINFIKSPQGRGLAGKFGVLVAGAVKPDR